MGTAGREFAVTIPIEPGDTQARVFVILPTGCRDKPKARVVVQREGEADISETVEVSEVAA